MRNALRSTEVWLVALTLAACQGSLDTRKDTLGPEAGGNSALAAAGTSSLDASGMAGGSSTAGAAAAQAGSGSAGQNAAGTATAGLAGTPGSQVSDEGGQAGRQLAESGASGDLAGAGMSSSPPDRDAGASGAGGVPTLDGETGDGGTPPLDEVPDAAGGDDGSAQTGDSCARGGFILCDDFETTAKDDIPDGWTRRGEEVWVDDDQSFSGKQSLKLGAIPSRERRIARSAWDFGSQHWGRIYYRVQLPVPDAFVHSTLVAFTGSGPQGGPSEYRFVDTVKQAIDTRDVGSRHNFIFNVQPERGSEFGRETSYDWEFDGQWHCLEYHVDASTQSFQLYLDGELELQFENGPGNYDRTDIPDSFDEIRIGWNNYQEAPPGFTAWIDAVAFAEERIGCISEE